MSQINSVIIDYTKKEATSFLCQAMSDETIRLRKASRGERNAIRQFLVEAFQVIAENDGDIQYQGMHSDDKRQEPRLSNK